MEILLWLVPPAVATVLAMAWVSWLGRERAEPDREEAVRRLGRALETQRVVGPRPRSDAPADRSTGVAVRPSAQRARSAPPPPPAG